MGNQIENAPLDTQEHSDTNSLGADSTPPAGGDKRNFAGGFTTRPTRWAAGAGLLAAGSAIAVVELISGLTTRVPSLILAVSDSIIDSRLIPFWLRTWSIDQLGTAQKPVLFYGVLVVTLLLGSLTGIFALKRPWIGPVIFAAFAVVGGLAAASNPDAHDGMAAVAAGLAAVVGMGVLWRLLSLLRPSRRAAEPSRQVPSEVNRRWFLTAAGATAMGALLASGAGRFLASRRGVEDSRSEVAEKLNQVLNAAPSSTGSTRSPGGGSENPPVSIETTTSTTRGRTSDGATTAPSAPATPATTTSQAAPATTTSAPGGSTTSTPGSTTSTSGATTSAPSTTTSAPGATTSAPTTTRAAPTTTRAAPPTTQPPPTTTTARRPNRYFDGEVGGISPIITPNNNFYLIDTAISKPVVRADTWRLQVTGMVDNPYTLNFDELLAMGLVEEAVTLSCVSNSVGGNLVGNAVWRGVPLRSILDRAGVQRGATQIVGRSVDNWNSGFPTPLAYDGRVALVAVSMNGEPLPREHGFPVRLVVAGLYGYVSATKWLEEIRLTTWEGFDSYWVPRGWAKEGPIKTQSRIDVPRSGARLQAGRVAVAGVAWAPSRSIERVEVQIDNGPWVRAELSLNMSINSWRQWLYAWDAKRGNHQIRVRATDGAGRTQTSQRTPPAPNGASGWHTISVSVA